MSAFRDLAEIAIGPVNPSQFASTEAVVAAAFGRTAEANLVRRLRSDGDVAVELAATRDEEMIGHVLFSRLAVYPPGLRIAALAPLSVRPEFQNLGTGSALVRAGLAECAERELDAVAVLGDPAYYTRFGFAEERAASLISPYKDSGFQALEFRAGALAHGFWRVTYPRAFAALEG